MKRLKSHNRYHKTISYTTKADLVQSPHSTEARKVIGLALRSHPVSKEMAVKSFAIPSQVNFFKTLQVSCTCTHCLL